VISPVRTAAVAVGLGLLAAGPLRADDARDWLERMFTAAQTRSYEGTFVHRSGERMETMRVVHRAQDGRVSERLWSEDEPGREVIRDEEKVTCIFADRRSVLVESRRPGEAGAVTGRLPRYDQELIGHYDFLVLGDGRKLGRSVVVLEVRPRDEFRYGYKLWIDEQSAMPLKVQMRDNGGRAVEEFQFTEIRLDPQIPDSSFEPSLELDEFTWYEQESSRSDELSAPEWMVADLPPGFAMTLAERRPLPASPDPVTQLVYSDGLASVSVFIEPAGEGQESMDGFSRLGAANAFSLRQGPLQVTAVGEVPGKTVRRIAESVARRPPDQERP
jgi:sigma-E factor negative regulatory protein RseB